MNNYKVVAVEKVNGVGEIRTKGYFIKWKKNFVTWVTFKKCKVKVASDGSRYLKQSLFKTAEEAETEYIKHLKKVPLKTNIKVIKNASRT